MYEPTCKIKVSVDFNEYKYNYEKDQHSKDDDEVMKHILGLIVQEASKFKK